MGVLADAALAGGGQDQGVITQVLQAKEIAHQGLASLEVVKTMHERKAAMADKADAFIMLPGGFGTLDEFLEAERVETGFRREMARQAGQVSASRQGEPGTPVKGYPQPAHGRLP